MLKDPDMLQIALRPAVELSYLRKEEQADLFAIMDEMDCTPSHAQAIKMRRMSEAKTGDERLSKDAMAVIMEEEKGNQKEQFKIPKEKNQPVFCAGDAHAEDRGHHCQGAGTLPQTPAQFREIAHSQGGSAPICGKRQLVPVPPLHTSPLPNNLNSLKKKIFGEPGCL